MSERRSRAMQRLNYAAIFSEGLNADGWIEIEPVAHLTRPQFVNDLRTAAASRGLNIQAMWASKGWMMIQVTRIAEPTPEPAQGSQQS
jgi:uncharacterized membrane protein